MIPLDRVWKSGLGAILCAGSLLAQDCVSHGKVQDATGAAVLGAVIRSGPAQSITDAEGRFRLEAPCGGTLTVRAAGFSVERVPLQADHEVEITLHVNRAEDRVTVESSIGEAETTSIGEREMRSAPAVGTDSRLREVPGFSLYRRTPSWSANPTTQGISLHGVGASGASRGLALLDGIPLNDPFGGWIYWGRAVPGTLESAEVSETSASELYGSDAIGGVVTLLRPRTEKSQATLEASAGNLFTPSLSGTGSLRLGAWTATLIGDGFRTNGYIPVAENARGPVDTVSSSRHSDGEFLLERNSKSGRVFAGGELYGEDRQNGTVLQTNSASIREVEAGADWSGAAGDWNVRGFGGTEDLRQTFTSINLTRTTETLTRDQTVPAGQAGASLLWSKIAGRNLLSAGTEMRWVDGESLEWAFTAGAPTSIQRNGGGQWREGVFGEDRLRLGSRTLLTLGARYDHWSNVNGFSSTAALVSTVTSTSKTYADRLEDAFSPKAALSFAATRRITLHASGAEGFRAPTLNELYRSFRVGNVLTTANAALKAERSVNFAGGATLDAGAAGNLQLTYFWTEIHDPVANVTLAVTPALITRMRENLGKLRSQGVDASWEKHFLRRWSVTAAYEFANPRVVAFPADPTLVGLWIPQVARHNATVAVSYFGSRWTIHAAAHGQGKQFDDDRNTLPLGGYAALDAFVSRALGHGVEIYLAGENLTDRRYEVGKTPVVSLGPPVLARAGLRWNIGKR